VPPDEFQFINQNIGLYHVLQQTSGQLIIQC